jgi:predicted O-methyltransferase YrrM
VPTTTGSEDVSEQDSNWKYADYIVTESEAIAKARAQSLELGIEPLSPAMGAQVAVLAAATNAVNIVEIGTGAGVSGLWLLHSSSRSVLTSIDSEVEHLGYARQAFADARIASNRVRLITGRAFDVLPRMNENSYDVVYVDGDPAQVIENVEHGLRLARTGGTVLVPHALWRGRVADPAQRDDVTSAFRTLVQEIASSTAVVSALSPVGDGLLQITKLD